MRRLLFKLVSAIHVFVYRLTGGKFGGEIREFQLLLLTTTGRKTGEKRTIPLGYFAHDGGYVIIGSNAQLWARLMELAPQYGNYAKKTRREIPLVILRPA